MAIEAVATRSSLSGDGETARSAWRDGARGCSDHLLGLEVLQVASGEAEPLSIDLGVVLAEQR
jgi:hypothetical protein